MIGLNLYLSGNEREKLIDILNDYIHMVSTMYENTGSEELEKILQNLMKTCILYFISYIRVIMGKSIIFLIKKVKNKVIL